METMVTWGVACEDIGAGAHGAANEYRLPRELVVNGYEGVVGAGRRACCPCGAPAAASAAPPPGAPPPKSTKTSYYAVRRLSRKP